MAQSLERSLDKLQPARDGRMDPRHAVMPKNPKRKTRESGLRALDQRARLVDVLIPPRYLQHQGVVIPGLLAQNGLEEQLQGPRCRRDRAND